MSQELYKSDVKKVELLGGKDSGLRIVQSSTKQVVETQPAIEIQQQQFQTQAIQEEKYISTQSIRQPRIQSQQVLRQNINIPQVSYPGTYSVQQNCQEPPPLQMNIIVVSKEEIEAPWRLECEYLQSIIADLERRKVATQVVEKIVKEVVTDDSKINSLEAQLRQFRQENDNLKLQLLQLKQSYEAELNNLRGDVNLHSANAANAEQLQAQFYALRQELENQISQLKRNISDLELQLKQTNDENDRYKLLLGQKDSELQSLRIQITQLQTSASDTSQLRDLQNQLRLAKDEIGKQEALLKQVNAELLSWKTKYTTLEQDQYSKNNDLIMQLRDYENKFSGLSTEIDRLNIQLKSKDADLDELRYKYTQLESQGTTVIQEKVTYLSQEVEVWKQKFIKTNHDYNKCQEELTMCQAELESIKKSGSKKEVVVTSRTVTSSRGGNTLTVTGPQTTTQSTVRRSQFEQQ